MWHIDVTLSMGHFQPSDIIS